MDTEIILSLFSARKPEYVLRLQLSVFKHSIKTNEKTLIDPRHIHFSTAQQWSYQPFDRLLFRNVGELQTRVSSVLLTAKVKLNGTSAAGD